MAQAPDYTVNYDFSDFQATNPTTPLPGDRVDTELAEIASVIATINDNIALIQRDDGELANGTVGIDQVDSGLAATMAASGNPRGPWVTATSYAQADAVTSAGVAYICVTAHTSGTFATDLAADKWMAIGGSAGGTVFTPAGSISAATVQVAIEELDAEKQPLDGTLTLIAGVNPSAAQMHYFVTASSVSAISVTSAALLLLDDADAAAMRATLGSGAAGDAVFTAATASAARAALSAGATGDAVFTAATASAAQVALSLVPGTNVQAYDADTLKSDQSANLTAGYSADSYSALGVVSSGTVTLNPANGNFQHYTNNGAHTLAPPSAGNCVILVHVTNGASAGAITTSGFTDADGDSLTTTSAAKFELYVTRHNGSTRLDKKAYP